MADDLIERLKATEGHTPGPWWAWQVGATDDGEYFICTGVEGDSGGSLFEGGGVMGSNVENDANAKLMALAPEMKARILSEARDLLAARVTVAGRSMTVAELIAAHERAERERDNAVRSALSKAQFAARMERHNREGTLNAFERGACASSRNIEGDIIGLIDALLPAPPAPTETEGA